MLFPRRSSSRLLALCLRVVLVLIALVTLATSALALTAIERDFDGLVARAETIFKGTVTAQESLWTGEGPNRHIVTRVTFQVLDTYKGAAASSQTLEFLGGTVAGVTLAVPDMPKFALGETAVLFVVGNGVQLCPLVGAYQGRFPVQRDAATASGERVFTHDGNPVVDTALVGQTNETTGAPKLRAYRNSGANSAVSSDAFKEAITAKLRERKAKGLAEVLRE